MTEKRLDTDITLADEKRPAVTEISVSIESPLRGEMRQNLLPPRPLCFLNASRLATKVSSDADTIPSPGESAQLQLGFVPLMMSASRVSFCVC
jgi:hypothetical protein